MSAVPVKLLVWTPEYAVHGGEMDREHETWFEIVNRLHEAMLVGKGVEHLQTVFEEAAKFGFDHFVHEEELMAAAHYPGLREHVQRHDELRAIAREWVRRFERGEFTMTIELSLVLAEGIKDHILAADRSFGEFLTAAHRDGKR
jgi:hemerythrin